VYNKREIIPTSNAALVDSEGNSLLSPVYIENKNAEVDQLSVNLLARTARNLRAQVVEKDRFIFLWLLRIFAIVIPLKAWSHRGQVILQLRT
jgi:hypothetical protein